MRLVGGRVELSTGLQECLGHVVPLWAGRGQTAFGGSHGPLPAYAISGLPPAPLGVSSASFMPGCLWCVR